jgi:ketosteroid isomerase-like protein
MKLTALLLIAISVVIAGTRDDQAPPSGDTAMGTAQTNVAAAEIRRLAAERSEALVRRDIAALDRILATEFIYTNASGAVLDKEAYLSRYVRDPNVKWLSQDIDDIAVRVFGDSAVVTCRVKDRADFDGQVLDAAFRSTYVYVRNAARWQCVAGHTGPAGE